MASKGTRRGERLTMPGLPDKYGPLVLWAMRKPEAWDEVISGPPAPALPNGTLSDSAKRQLYLELDAVYRALLENAKGGDAVSGAVAAQIALRKTAFSGG